MLRQENPNTIGYKFSFPHLNWLCFVLPWLDACENRLKFPLQKWKLKTTFLASNHGRTQKNEFLTMVRQEKLNPIGY